MKLITKNNIVFGGLVVVLIFSAFVSMPVNANGNDEDDDGIDDEIEEENSFGAYGGIAINLTPSFIANLEGEILTQKSISLALEYLF